MAPRSRTAPIGVAWRVADPLALIGTSNFFELAVATAIALFGFQSGAALATVVGVLNRVHFGRHGFAGRASYLG